jgi:hypothetical protein
VLFKGVQKTLKFGLAVLGQLLAGGEHLGDALFDVGLDWFGVADH